MEPVRLNSVFLVPNFCSCEHLRNRLNKNVLHLPCGCFTAWRWVRNCSDKRCPVSNDLDLGTSSPVEICTDNIVGYSAWYFGQLNGSYPLLPLSTDTGTNMYARNFVLFYLKHNFLHFFLQKQSFFHFQTNLVVIIRRFLTFIGPFRIVIKIRNFHKWSTAELSFD